ncbi:acyltransferase [Mycobacterium alsense]|uniref:Acyltransferase n=1 Tax=Mycobacterium alsense TaxID=324058 RepID=A0AA42BWD4_9MYCO|nr:condensation domain-containing protein [Mycobacterium alsense]MCV7377275.1 acyltransferase [Mycobacterium alsense]OQZ88359.1 acyltransferase [Mycobacterium alsense]ORV84710.1 acyltransferase [Mycobacterium interjectum]
MFIGGGSEHDSLRVGNAYDWNPEPGPVVTWEPTPGCAAKARQAPVSPVPPSSMQAGHLRGFVEFRDRGLDYSRAVMGSWEVPGRCDIRAMTYVINAHLRRHATYHSWFEYSDDNIVRHTLKNPRDIQFVAKEYGALTQQEWRDHVLATPDPLQWDCFRFGIIQYDDRFALYAVVDHLHCDPMLIAGLYVEIVMNYNALLEGKAPVTLPPAASYDDFCMREHACVSGMTLESPEVKKWIEFAEANGGTLPDFPLPLGDQSIPCGGDTHVERLLGPEETAQFEALCQQAGARFSGGLFACAALAQYELTGAETYYGLTPTDKRKSPADFMTVGWFTGVVPFTVPVDPNSFEETARAAQASFDANMDLANVPFDKVLELAPWLRRHGPQFTMMSYMDAGLPPLSAIVATALDGVNATAFTDGRSPAYMYSTVFRLFDEVSIMVSYPNNPVARESVQRYTEAMKSVFERVVAGKLAAVPVRVAR